MKKALRAIVLLTVFFSNTPGSPTAAAAVFTNLVAETSWCTSLTEKKQPPDRVPAKPSEQKAGQIGFDLKITDRFAGATVLKKSETAPDKKGCYERKRLVRADSKYSLILLEESFQTDPQTGVERLLRQSAMVADHVMIKVPVGVSEDQLNQAVSVYGGHIRKKMYSPDLYLVEFQNVDLDSVSQAVQNFSKASGSITYAEPDYIVSVNDTTPNDTDFNLLWGMHNTGQTIGGQTGVIDADIDVPAAWDISTGNSNIVVAVIDSGIDYNHPDLAANMWRNPGEIPGNGIDDDSNGFIDDVYGWDFFNDDNDPFDDRYHGTHCASIIGAVGNNGEGIAGVNWTVRLMALKFLSRAGNGATSDAVDAMHYATMMKAKLTSNSWGGGGYSQGLFDAIEEANNSNILFVAAAGNSGDNTDVWPNYPSSYTNGNIIAVAATDNRDQLAWFSNYGLLSVDLGAPGVNIYSCAPGGLYQYLNGTSMAAPHVAGACALAWSINLDATAMTIKQAILDGTDPVAALSGKWVTGGRLNIYNALQKLEQGIPIRPVADVSFSGFKGGPFTPLSSTYTISNIGTNSLFWTASKTAAWLDISSTTGNLSPNQSNAVVISINAATANALAVGTYTDTLTFSNTASIGVRTRTVSLMVRGEITFDSNSYTAGEANGTALINVFRAGNTNRAVTVDFATSDGTATAGIDYVATNGTLVFAAGDTVKNFTVPILNDSLPSEGNESVILTLSNPTGGGTLGDPSTAGLTILDDDVDTHYVSLTGGNVAPYTNWTMAATSIQPAVSAAFSGDVVQVGAGMYVLSSQISVPAGIMVKGEGAGATIVDGNNAVRCFYLAGSAVVAEMTITKGETRSGATGAGVQGGILYNCTISSNSGYYGGGACYSTLYNCTIFGNSAGGSGGGADSCVLYNCLIFNNASTQGGGVCSGTLYNCTVSGNESTGNGARDCTLNNSIIYPDSLEGSTLLNCWTNNPKFASDGDYSLRFDSPCIGAADPSIATTNDIQGIARDQFPDIGAYEYVALDGYYTLTVNNGAGSGSYTNGTQVAILADAPVPGMTFDRWTGDFQCVNNATYTNALVTMPAQDITLTATYKNLSGWHTLTVSNGTGGGLYSNGVQVTITAIAPAGMVFHRWTGDTQIVAGVFSLSTTVTMPAQDAVLTAICVDASNGIANVYWCASMGFHFNADPYVGILGDGTGNSTFTQLMYSPDAVKDNILPSGAGAVNDVVWSRITISEDGIANDAEFFDSYAFFLLQNCTRAFTNGYVYALIFQDNNVQPGDWYFSTPLLALNKFYMAPQVIEMSTDWVWGDAIDGVYGAQVVEEIVLTGSAGANGTISPASTNVLTGGSANFVITANSYYRIATLTTNGTAVTGVSFDNNSTRYNYTWNNVQAAGTLAATFTAQITDAGTPYEWLAQYGLTNYNADAALDQDSDGMKTWQEYIAGTDPSDPDSVLELAGNVLSGDRIGILWFGVQNRAYTFQYQYADSLNTNNWQAASNEISGAGAVLSLTNTITDDISNAFYRVEVRFGDSSTVAANIQGCTKIALPSNQFVLVSLGFNNESNTVSNLFKYLRMGSTVQVWDTTSQNWKTYQRGLTGWGANGSNRVQRGTSEFIKSPIQTNLLLSGSVPTEGTTTVYKANGYATPAYPYPVRISFTNTALAKTAIFGDKLNVWINNAWTTFSRGLTGWGPATNLQINPGQGFMFLSTTNKSIDEIRPYVIE